MLMSGSSRGWFGSKRRTSVILGGAGLACFVTYAMIIPYMVLSGLHEPGTLLPRAHRLGTTSVTLAVNTGSGAARQLLSTSSEQRWAQLWNSELYEEIKAFQDIKHIVDQMRYQQLRKDLEPQNTAGIDIALVESLHKFARVSRIQDTQAWIRRDVTDAVFRAVNALQQPANCSAARVALCDLNKGCGFGCQLHHATHCLATAIALNRTLILEVEPWSYASDPGHGWSYMFEPVTACRAADLPAAAPPTVSAMAFHDDAQVVSVGIIDMGASRHDPPSLPQDVLEVVGLFNSRPEAWWVSALMSFLLRPSAASHTRLAEFRRQQDWASPIVGVHVRRTDKLGGEALLHGVEEYMAHVERHCDLNLPSGWQVAALAAAKQADTAAGPAAAAGAGPAAGQVTVDAAPAARVRTSNCSVYLASDEPAVAAEIRQKYRHIHLIVNEQGLKSGGVSRRYSWDGLAGVYDDIVHLAETDLIVGTFSSQVSRSGYEIAQVNSTYGSADVALNYHSVDSMYYFGGQHLYRFCASHDYTTKDGRQVAAGTELECPIIFEFQNGLERCKLAASGEQVLLPPATVTACGSGMGSNPYRSILPAHMRRPDKAVTAAALLGGDAAAGAPHGAAAVLRKMKITT